MSPFEAAEVALRILHMLAQLHPAVDPRGYILQPLPLVHRQLVAPSSLPHLIQACPWSAGLSYPQAGYLAYLHNVQLNSTGCNEKVFALHIQGAYTGRGPEPMPQVIQPVKFALCWHILSNEFGACQNQVLLTGEPVLVALAAALIEEILTHNAPARGRLYQTGFFYFALAYCGSNLTEITRLFKVCASMHEGSACLVPYRSDCQGRLNCRSFMPIS